MERRTEAFDIPPNLVSCELVRRLLRAAWVEDHEGSGPEDAQLVHNLLVPPMSSPHHEKVRQAFASRRPTVGSPTRDIRGDLRTAIHHAHDSVRPSCSKPAGTNTFAWRVGCAHSRCELRHATHIPPALASRRWLPLPRRQRTLVRVAVGEKILTHLPNPVNRGGTKRNRSGDVVVSGSQDQPAPRRLRS